MNDQPAESPSRNIKRVERTTLHQLVHQCPMKRMEKKFEYMESKIQDIMGCGTKKLKKQLSYFKFEYEKRWHAASRKRNVFEDSNKSWLDGSINLPASPGKTVAPKNSGRPKKKFQELSERSKRRITQSVRDEISPDKLVYAAQMSLRSSGNTVGAELIKDMGKSALRAKEIKMKLKSTNDSQLSAARALGIFIEAELTRGQYNIIRSANKKIYPCYSRVQKAKMLCYPDPQAFIITDTHAEVRLQELLDHTCSRLCLYLEDVLNVCSAEEKSNLNLIYKWGCDGSHQSIYKQKFASESDSDANVFQSSLVPIRLTSHTANGIKVVWQNPLPSSPRYCRPIRIIYSAETTDLIRAEVNYIQSQIAELQPTAIPTTSATVKYTLLLTMVDGKVCNSLTETSSSMRCYLCRATVKDFNNLSKVRGTVEGTTQFGLSVLHAKIRLFENMLHLGYKIPLKKWQARSGEEKDLVAKTKEGIQKKFYQEMGLYVDIPKQGFGNTNDGNTARKFFEDPGLSSRITGVDEGLIYRLKIILEAISSHHEIDTTKYSKYALETAHCYVNLYKWYPMSPTLHKILIHGEEIINAALVPIGQLSEEAAEARNKYFRQYRQGFARKFSRKACNTDIINRLLLNSDPYITSLRSRQKKSAKYFSRETINLFKSHDMPSQHDETSSSDEMSISD